MQAKEQLSDHWENEKKLASDWYADLRDRICSKLEDIEAEFSDTKFERKNWQRTGGGGGTMSLMRGEVFEKAGVNISTVHGKFSEEFAKQMDGAVENGGEFWASGVSVVIHPKSPFVPAVHMNTRMIVTSKLWFGGGTDLTPSIPNEEHSNLFHSSLRKMCDKHNKNYYNNFKKECDEYFYLKHRKEPRGIGGIFYDGLNTCNWDADFLFNKEVGEVFLQSYSDIIKDSYKKNWSDEDKQKQLLKRGRYVEFNLLYDRGTKFGIMTDGNIEAILMSLPPEVKW